MMIILCCINWTAVSAITSALMVVITLITLVVSSCQNRRLRKQNDEQLKEVKRQWEEEQRPYLEVAIVRSAYIYGRYELEFRNIGKTSAESISFELDKSFLERLDESSVEYFTTLGKNVFKILPNEIRRFRIMESPYISNSHYYVGNTPSDRETYDTLIDLLKTNGLTISVSYNGRYSLCENITLDEHRTQTLTAIDAIAGVSMQLANIRMDHKPKDENPR